MEPNITRKYYHPIFGVITSIERPFRHTGERFYKLDFIYKGENIEAEHPALGALHDASSAELKAMLICIEVSM